MIHFWFLFLFYFTVTLLDIWRVYFPRSEYLCLWTETVGGEYVTGIPYAEPGQ